MKKTAVSIVTLFLLTLAVGAFATEVENQASPAVATPQPAAEITPIPSDAPATAPVTAEIPVAPAEVPAPVDPEAQVVENLEFKSGEVTTIDEATKSVTMKLYGETETAGNEQILTVKVNEATDITDGEKDRDLKSLTAGTEVDVEYDPINSVATYIFVY